ncbi:MAG: nitroreductase family protein [Deltaproteobacteria bacterium]|nr:nitroreductase family protein [Deltaproteobacteria bacterium]MBI3295868.1 nitroreductase family protein [Deltaproteobacteria bacterium]
MESRRSIRLFEKDPVPEAVIQHCLDLALLAPNSSNLQPWEFHWVRTPAKREELNRACLSQAAANTAAELIVCVARTRTWRRNCADMIRQIEELRAKGTRIPKATTDYYYKLVPFAYTQGPLSLLGFLKRIGTFFYGLARPTTREPLSHTDMKIWAIKSTALACENLMLAFRAHDFDTCPMEGIDSRRVRKLLQLPGDALVPMVLAVGKRRPAGVTLPRIRAERSWFVKIV